MPSSAGFLQHRSSPTPRNVFVELVQLGSSAPISPRVVDDLRARLEHRFFLGDIVRFKIRGFWHVGVVIKVIRPRDSWTQGLEHPPHKVGLDSSISLEESFQLDDPMRYVYFVSLLDKHVAEEPLEAYPDILSRDMPYFVKAITDRISTASRNEHRRPSSQPQSPPCYVPWLQASTSPLTAINIAFGNPINSNTGSGSFVSGSGPGSIHSVCGSGTFNNHLYVPSQTLEFGDAIECHVSENGLEQENPWA